MLRCRRGQVIAELALTLPFLLFLIVAFIELANLMAVKAQQDRQTETVADWAAEHNGQAWNGTAAKVLPGCDVNVVSAGRDLIEATSRCQYHPVMQMPTPLDWIVISSHVDKAISPTPTPSPSDFPSPSPSDTSSSSSTGAPASAGRWTSASSLAASRGFSGEPFAAGSKRPS